MSDDHSDNPYVFQLDAPQFLSLGISDSENGREDLTVGIYGMYDGKFQLLHEAPAKFRVGTKLPCLKRWKK